MSLPRLPLAGVALAAIAGILLAEYAAPPPSALLAVTIVALLLAPWRSGLVPLWIATAGCFALAHLWQWTDAPARSWAGALTDEPRHGEVTGILADEPREILRGTQRTGLWRARMIAETWNIDGHRIVLRQPLILRWSAKEQPRYGDRWTIAGEFDRPAPARNPGEFNAAEWFARQGVYLELRGRNEDRARRIGENDASPLRAAAFASRAWMLHTLGLGLEDAPHLRALIAGVTLGARDTAADQYEDAFRLTGTFHLFSVSGLHVGMVALLLWLLLRMTGLGRRRAVLIIIPSLFFYALVTGASAPSLRAAVMLAAAFAGFLLDRPVSPANSLAAAALLLLGYDTNQLFAPGFQMSFSIVAAIFLLSPPLQEFFAVRLRPDPFLPRRLYHRGQVLAADAGRALASTLGVSAAAWLGSLPLTVALFHLLPLLAIPANMLAVPLAFGILAVSMLALLGGLLTPWLAIVFNSTSWGLASLLVAVVGNTAALPGSYFHLPPSWLQPPARLTVFDLSTGGAQLLRTPQAAWLFDTGTAYDAERIIEPALRRAGIGRLTGLVLTHGDNEHVGGAAYLNLQARPDRIVESVLRDRSRVRRSWHAVLQAGGQSKALVLPGDRLRLDRYTEVHILSPENRRGARTADDQVVAARIDTGAFRVLLMSDAGAETENHLARHQADALRSDILVLGRHGEDVFATETFLEAVQPRVIILAARDPFRDGSDEAALRARLTATGAEIFTQDDCGAVITTFHRDRADLRSFLGDRHIVLPPRPAR